MEEKPMKKFTHVCLHCRKVFQSNAANTQYCSIACRTEYKAIKKRNEEYERRPRANKELDRVAAEANAAGMSYGKYVAMLRYGR